MTTFKRFEEMHAWQSARKLVSLIYDEIYSKANLTERQISALIGYLARSKQGRMVKEDAAPYSLEIPDDLDLSDP